MGNQDNPRNGAEFEKRAQEYFSRQDIELEKNMEIEIGAGEIKGLHKFDLGSPDPAILVECKKHTWTGTGNSPSAKLSVWNEAMYYFLFAPSHYQKILFVLKSKHPKRGETLAQHYVNRYEHLIPYGVEIWEYDLDNSIAIKLFPKDPSEVNIKNS